MKILKTNSANYHKYHKSWVILKLFQASQILWLVELEKDL